ncbi:MAG: hypothetical protein IPO41_16640 [Acidobacteria bacterium]|nr:hypothetical protein [Acidobacteriota bacterium]MBP7473683.1 hypothetical protein [Pyrinomonadaceae bacterium]MBP9109672.1 hypothetical protein [Pyrinomonadaceae bacterium]
MNTLFLLAPEVAGGFGDKTVIANQERLKQGLDKRPDVTHLEYVFEDWLGDELLTSTPCYILTEPLAAKVRMSDLQGFDLSPLEVSTSAVFSQLHPKGLSLPEFVSLRPSGQAIIGPELTVLDWSGDDFCLGERGELVISTKCLRILNLGQLKNCEIIPLVLNPNS